MAGLKEGCLLLLSKPPQQPKHRQLMPNAKSRLTPGLAPMAPTAGSLGQIKTPSIGLK